MTERRAYHRRFGSRHIKDQSAKPDISESKLNDEEKKVFDAEDGNNGNHNNNISGFQMKMKIHQQRMISCNGDCGSDIAKIIDSCVYPSKVM